MWGTHGTQDHYSCKESSLEVKTRMMANYFLRQDTHQQLLMVSFEVHEQLFIVASFFPIVNSPTIIVESQFPPASSLETTAAHG